MKVVTSDYLLRLSRFHTTFYMILALFDLDWTDIGVCEEWSAVRIANTLESIVSFNTLSGDVNVKPIPSSIINRLLDTANHPHLGFPNKLLPNILSYFVAASKRGWSNSKLFTAASGVVLARHFSNPSALLVC